MSSEKMRAVACTQYGGPEVLKLIKLPVPQPKPDEICIHIKATTVTVADVRIRSFNVPLSFWLPARLMLGITKPKNPVLGVELSGVVDKVGHNITNFKPGDSVYAATLLSMGGYAEYICLPSSAAIALKPDQLSYHEAAAIPIGACTALHFLRKADVKSGQHVLIYGASGSVGTYAIQLAKYMGADVTAVCSAPNMTWVKSLGADYVLDYQHLDFQQQLKQYDVVFVAVDKMPFELCLRVMKETGVYINISLPLRTPRMVWTAQTTRKKIFGGEKPDDTSADLEFLNTLIAAGKLKVVVDRTYSLEQIQEAHQYVEQGHKSGNVCITV